MEPQPTVEPIIPSKIPLIILSLLLIISLAANAYFFYQQSSNNSTNTLPAMNDTANQKSLNTTPNPPTIENDITLTNFSHTYSVNTDRLGNVSYQLQFTYPSNWTTETVNIRPKADLGGNDCVDFEVNDNSTGSILHILPTCGSYSGKKIDTKESSFSEIGRVIQSGGGVEYNRTIRYVSASEQRLWYRDAMSMDANLPIEKSQITDSVIIFPKPGAYSDFFMVTHIYLTYPGETPTESVLETADAIVKSLQVTRPE
jgi:hypothetical protein